MLDYIRRECRSVIITVDAPGRERVEEERKLVMKTETIPLRKTNLG